MEYPGRMNMTHTGIHYGYLSHPGDLGSGTNPIAVGYPGVAEVSADVLNVKNDFEVTITPRQSGILYFRAHAVLDGQNYWSDERSVEVE